LPRSSRVSDFIAAQLGDKVRQVLQVAVDRRLSSSGG